MPTAIASQPETADMHDGTDLDPDLPLSVTLEVRDHCLCLQLRRAARTTARRFDDAFRPHGITNGQFSILMSLNRPVRPNIGEVADLLAMDATTLTAAMKPLRRNGWLEVTVDPDDRRSRRLHLTDSGRDILRAALPVWRSTHADLAAERPGLDLDGTRRDLVALATSSTSSAMTCDPPVGEPTTPTMCPAPYPAPAGRTATS